MLTKIATCVLLSMISATYADEMTPEKFKAMRSKQSALKSVKDSQFPYKIKRFKSPESILQSEDGTVYISEINEFGKDGDGQVTRITRKGKREVFAKNLDDPKGLAMIEGNLYVADKTKIIEIQPNGAHQIYVDTDAFPKVPQFLNDLEVDPQGNLYVSDSGDILGSGKGGAIYKIDKNKIVTKIVDGDRPEILSPNGLLYEGRNSLLEVDFTSGVLYRINMSSGDIAKVAEGFGGGDGIVKTNKGKIFISDWKGGVINTVNAGKARMVYNGLISPADIALSNNGNYLMIPLMKSGEVDIFEIQ